MQHWFWRSSWSRRDAPDIAAQASYGCGREAHRPGGIACGRWEASCAPARSGGTASAFSTQFRTNGSGVHPKSAPGSRTLFPLLLRPAATTPPLRTLDSKPMCNAYNHPPGCRCGWGGEGHLGGNHLGGPGSVAQARPSWPADDFCRPTTYPICGSSQVWFIRHNGGSIWADSLGIPWPIHHCFDEGDSSSRPLHQLAAASRSLFEPRLGIITATRRDLILGDLHLDLAWGEGRTAKLRCRLAGPADGFLGDLVVVFAQIGRAHV